MAKHLHVVLYNGEKYDIEADTYSKDYEKFKRGIKSRKVKTLWGFNEERKFVAPERMFFVMLELTYLITKKRIYKFTIDGIDGEIYIDYPKTPVKYYNN